jgi:hypothetical protein
MERSLVNLMEELVASIEQREAARPEGPARAASARIRELERELAQRLEELRRAGAAGAASHGRTRRRVGNPAAVESAPL